MNTNKIEYSEALDRKWQEIWAKSELYRFDETKMDEKYYLLEMFSYPSGKNLHIGHWWNYCLSDCFGRFKHLQGYQVFHPPGFDAFGLPAENHAIKTGIHPEDSTKKNIETMEEQFFTMGTTYDWNYEIVTCYPEYYKWTQWLFIKLYEKGLAYRKEAPVNWCTSCLTVLANEQVVDGVCERCESEVIEKCMTQWFFKITDYAEDLLTGLNDLDWPSVTKTLQTNWIGKDNNDNGKYRLRDWLVSRQRYWGTPIPIIHCKHCGTVPVLEADLPVKLPYDVNFTPTSNQKPHGFSPLAACESFVNTTCPQCGLPAERDTDTLDTFICSSWYFLRFFDTGNNDVPFDPQRVHAMLPVDKYVGGIEHATMHLLYARFITRALYDMGYINFKEPFTSLFHQGIILGSDGKKMSKRNGAVNPDIYIKQYGADVFRMYLGFGFSFSEGGQWSDDGLKGIAKFIKKVCRVFESYLDYTGALNLHGTLETPPQKDLEYLRNHTIKQVAADYEAFQFNTAIARIMEFVTGIVRYQSCDNRNPSVECGYIKDLIVILSPVAPHLTEELWERMGYLYSVHNQHWPHCDETALAASTVKIVIQINGKLRDVIEVDTDISDADLKNAVLSSPKIKPLLVQKDIKKLIVIKGKLVNIVC